MTNPVNDYQYMARAIQLAERGLFTTDPNPHVGCVLVRDGDIVGEGWHQQAGEPHAEILALRTAGEQAKAATAYISLEPCYHHGRTPPCSDALIEAGVKRVVVAMQDPNPQVAGQGLAQLKSAGIDVESGLLQAQAEALNPGFIQRMRHGRPYVRCKMAMSLDGRTAMASGESQWITSEAARRDVHRLRARSSAMLTGIGTVLADDPSLTARLDAQHEELIQPIRVILDSKLQMPASAKMLALAGRTLVLTVSADEKKASELRAAGAEVVVLEPEGERLNLASVMTFLAKQEINEVMVEAGPTLCGALMQAGLINELVVYMAPMLMGDTARGLMSLPGVEKMSDRVKLEIVDIRAVGRDWKMQIKVER
jgi:diaminohydroxyphosphoribosylaminopyrimidine deaminase/5-amino-6-(5-phosphoribosylamino)uracil reductase